MRKFFHGPQIKSHNYPIDKKKVPCEIKKESEKVFFLVFIV